MKDGKQFRDSKLDDQNFVMPALQEWCPGSSTPIWYHCTTDGSWADLHGCDIYAVDSHAFERHMDNGRGGTVSHQKMYDTKYMKTPHAWFVLDKCRPDDKILHIITTHYIYVFDDCVAMFPRKEAICLCRRKGYAVRRGSVDPDTGIYAEICTIPKADLTAMPGFVFVPEDIWKKFKSNMANVCAKWEY